MGELKNELKAEILAGMEFAGEYYGQDGNIQTLIEEGRVAGRLSKRVEGKLLKIEFTITYTEE